MKRLIITAIVCVVCLAFVQSVASQKKLIPLTIEDALAQKSFSPFAPISLSPDGLWIAYSLEDSRKRETRAVRYHYFSPSGVSYISQGCEVRVTNTQTGETQLLLAKDATSSWGPVWSPDGKYLAFYSDSGGVARLWIWDKVTHKARQVSDAIVRPYIAIEVPRWTPDSKRIVSKILPYGTTVEDAEDVIAAFRNRAKPSDGAGKATVTVFDSDVPPEGAIGFDFFIAYLADLAVIDIDKGTVKTLARGFRPYYYAISPDGQNVAFSHHGGYEALNSGELVFDLVVVSLISDSEPRIVAPKTRSSSGVHFSWSADSKLLSYVTSGWKAEGECFLVGTDGGQPRLATKTAHPSFASYMRPPLWDREGRFLYFLAAQGAVWKISVADGQAAEVARISERTVLDIAWIPGKGRFWSADGGRSLLVSTRDDETKQMGFYGVDLASGSITKLIEEDKSYGVTPFLRDISADGQTIAYVAEKADVSPDIWISDSNFRRPRQVTKTSPQFEQYQFGKSRLVEWRSIDGIRLRGTLLLPAGYKEGQRYPMVVFPYPNERRSDFVNRFGIMRAGTDNMQLFATRGYVVLLPDNIIREGSTLRDLGKSIMPGVDKIVEMGIADNDRVGLMGHSWGGYAVLSLIVQTTRFKAAVMRAGYGNIISAYGAMHDNGSARGQMLYDAGAGVHGMGGTPWEVRHRYIENSPVFYLDRVETPLLIIHGGSESNVAAHHADEIFVDMRRLGKKVVYARYAGEDHSEDLWGYPNQLDYLNRVIGWYDTYLVAH